MFLNTEVYVGVKMADENPGLFFHLSDPRLQQVCLKCNLYIVYHPLESQAFFV